MKKDLQTDSKDLQITLYSVIYIAGFVHLVLGAFVDSSCMSSPQILFFVLMASVRINGSCAVYEGHWRESPHLLIYQCLSVSVSDGVQQQVNILR